MHKKVIYKFIIAVVLFVSILFVLGELNKNHNLEGGHIFRGFNSINTFYFEPNIDSEQKVRIVFDGLDGYNHLMYEIYSLTDQGIYELVTIDRVGFNGEGFQDFFTMNVPPNAKYKIVIRLDDFWRIMKYVDIKIHFY